MNRLIISLLFSLVCDLSVAQAANSGEGRVDIPSERARIEAERRNGESRFSQQEAECYGKFAVTDCLHEVRLQRRQLLDDLRRQTVMLNDMERRNKTLSKLDRAPVESSPQKRSPDDPSER